MDQHYDLIAVGSSFATAFSIDGYLGKARPDARILVLERGRKDPLSWQVENRQGSSLQTDTEGVDRFTQDVQSVLERIQVSPAGVLIDPPIPVIEGLIFQFQQGAIRLVEDTVVRKYLLSSDFFVNGANESRTVKYLGWSDEYVPCVNPFADLG